LLETDIKNKERNITVLKEKIQSARNELKVIRKKYKELELYKKKDIYLQENYQHYEHQLDVLRKSKNNLLETCKEITEYRNKVLVLFEPVKNKLEEIMISKEELDLSLLQYNASKQNLENVKTGLNQNCDQKDCLHENLENLKKNYLNLSEKNNKTKKELKTQREKLESKITLMKVQHRYLERKKKETDSFGNELKSISNEIDLFAAKTLLNETRIKFGSKSARILKKIKPKSKLPK
jgi:chromosome segregation ATPase